MSTRQHTTLRLGAVLSLLTLAALACSSVGTIGNVSHCIENCLYQEGVVNQQLDAEEPIYYSTEGYTRLSVANVGAFCIPVGTSDEQLNRLVNEQMQGRAELATWPNCTAPRRIGGNQ